ncbi:MAG: Uma2 family endonuclease [Verrucomicrobiales bacterium]|jgi:Uma2 family endonuclease
MSHVLAYLDLVQRPEFQSLPYKVETSASGQIIMSPHLNIHSAFQRVIERSLEALMVEPGVALPEYAIETEDGVKTPDVVWLTPEELGLAREVPIAKSAPQICVEVKSKGNTSEELDRKARLYFAAGAREVWICDMDGCLTFLTLQGPVGSSQVCPDFPLLVDPFQHR